jgi:AcrR family transcriptional regulator
VPRGVAIPNVRERLFEAAERVIEGPSGLSGRAVTREAGCATGLLYRHFGDFDAFVAEFVLERFQQVSARAAALPGQAGSGTVAGNLAAAGGALFESNLLSLLSLVTLRPGSIGKGPRRRKNQTEGSVLRRAFADYLAAEQRLGRVTPDADTDALATALIATIHHLLLLLLLLLSHTRKADPRRELRRVINALVAGITPPAQPDRRPRRRAAR